MAAITREATIASVASQPRSIFTEVVSQLHQNNEYGSITTTAELGHVYRYFFLGWDFYMISITSLRTSPLLSSYSRCIPKPVIIAQKTK